MRHISIFLLLLILILLSYGCSRYNGPQLTTHTSMIAMGNKGQDTISGLEEHTRNFRVGDLAALGDSGQIDFVTDYQIRFSSDEWDVDWDCTGVIHSLVRYYAASERHVDFQVVDSTELIVLPSNGSLTAELFYDDDGMHDFILHFDLNRDNPDFGKVHVEESSSTVEEADGKQTTTTTRETRVESEATYHLATTSARLVFSIPPAEELDTIALGEGATWAFVRRLDNAQWPYTFKDPNPNYELQLALYFPSKGNAEAARKQLEQLRASIRHELVDYHEVLPENIRPYSKQDEFVSPYEKGNLSKGFVLIKQKGKQ